MRWGEDVQELKKSATTRVFRAWIEDWEKEAMTKQDPVNEAKLLEKYKNLCFVDDDQDGAVVKIWHKNLQWERKSRARGILVSSYHLIVSNPNAEEGEQESAFEINQNVCDYIAEYRQAPGIEVLTKGD